MSLPTMNLQTFMNKNKEKINAFLSEEIVHLKGPKILKDAMLYSLEAGGKRLRPILLLATVAAFEKDIAIGLPVACAVEMLHTYSLIHDDLPAMDDDELRRGKLTNHKVFGEANAILAGDALLTYSFELIASYDDPRITNKMKVELVQALAHAAGPEGMVGGQVKDLLAENQSELTVAQLENIHYKKTGKLLIFPVLAGAILVGASKEQVIYLKEFATHLGIAFQIRDDILDVEGDEEKIGKRVGSDSYNEKSTYPKLLTVAGATEKMDDHIRLAKMNLYKAEINHELLEALATFIMQRDN